MTNHDPTFGHYWFKSAIDLAYLAKKQHVVTPGMIPSSAEAKRLYSCAIVDARAAIDELHHPENRAWAFECMALIEHMDKMISEWAKIILSL